MKVKCTCDKWFKNINQFTDQQIYCNNRPGAPKFTGEIFKWCPWCGKKLIEDN